MDLNIRDFPEWLAKQLKQECLRNGVTLREYVIARLDFGDKASAALAMDKALELNKRRKDGASGSSGRSEYPEVKDLAPLEKRSTGSKSQVEHPAINREDVGSNPTRGYKKMTAGFCFLPVK